MDNSMSTATNEDGSGASVVSFGSGDSGGRLERSSRGRAGNSNASRNQVSALRSRVNRSSVSARQRKRLLRAIDDQANRRGNFNRRNLASISQELRDLVS